MVQSGPAKLRVRSLPLICPGWAISNTNTPPGRSASLTQAFAQGRYGSTSWNLNIEKRGSDELSPRRFLPGQADHGFGLIDTQDIVAGRDQLRRPDAAAATEIDDES